MADLERRQDDVLAQLDALDRQLTGLLKGLGVTLIDDAEAGTFAVASEDDLGNDEASDSLASPSGGFAKLPAEHGTAGSDQKRAA